MKKIFILLMLGLAAVGCSSTKQASSSANLVELSGKLEEMGMTTFQYGTHKLVSGEKTYALKSKLDLNKYLNKNVKIKGAKVAGYPVENGPEFIDVTAVAE
ncbi:hypothetical protein [Pedobacter frigoris]|uniref:Uncharacterized protein n=1 Tax=Pedobacter frigoris TaxID=2571272 RepID=A0A4U1CIN2_9SPHI|nr:hypothetical protein [Pedobacter frigoris]TKC05906.1 hypothetical protein FA047_11215 [Pedobacter frigoris]